MLAEEVAKACPPGRVHIVQGDFKVLADVVRVWNEALAWKGRIDVLVNNAAVQLWAGVNDPDAQWDAVFDETLKINVLAMARLTREAVKHFVPRGGGAVISISSQAAHRGVTSPESLAYAASKAGIKAFMQSVARAFARQGVVAYTEMALDFAAHRGGVEKLTEGLVMKEWVPPEDVANFVAFLASGRARHASGATIDITGATYIR